MAHKRPKRGISAGTVVMLCLCAFAIIVGGAVFLRISGDIGEISLDPKLLMEPVSYQAQNTAQGGEGSSIMTEGDGQDTPPEGSLDDAPPTQAPTPVPEPTLPQVRTLSLTATGQITVGADIRRSAFNDDAGVYDFNAIFSGLGNSLSGADLSIATLRTSLTGDESAMDSYNAPAPLAAGLSNAGVNLVNLGTDRVLDHGMAGLSATRDALASLGLASTGAYRDTAERQALPITEINGIRVGIVSYTGSISAAGKSAASEAEIAAAVRPLNLEGAVSDIGALRAGGADLIVVLAHWGSRTDAKSSRETRDIANAMVDAGADIILGTNPTAVQEIELRTVTPADGAPRNVFIAYSLGNFLIDDSRDTTEITGLILHLDIQWDTATQRAQYVNAWYMPTWIMRWRDAEGVNRFRVVPAGASVRPQDMTDSIYVNMKKSYQSIVNKLGSSIAQPRTDP